MINLDAKATLKDIVISLSYDGYEIKMYYDTGLDRYVQVVIKHYIPEGYVGGMEQKDIKCIGISEEYFRGIYGKFCKIDFGSISKSNTEGCDGWWFALEIGSRNLHMSLSLWSPERGDDDGVEEKKFFDVCDEIDRKIDAYNWFDNSERMKKDCTDVELEEIIHNVKDSWGFSWVLGRIPMERLKRILEYSDE